MKVFTKNNKFNKILFCLLILGLVMFFCGCKRESIALSDELLWTYLDAENSVLVWKGNVIIGPGDITLKCSQKFIYGICNKNRISTFFIFDIVNKRLIKNPAIEEIQKRYGITINLNDWYNHIEILGPHKTKESIKRLKEDIASQKTIE
jgi:lipoprotein